MKPKNMRAKKSKVPSIRNARRVRSAAPKLRYGPIIACQICKSPKLRLIVSFGHQPPVQSYLTAGQLQEPETGYPDDLVRCEDCGLVQINHAVDPRIVFPREYPYQSGMTKLLRDNFAQLAEAVSQRVALASTDLVVDIGSNDGTLLQGFKARGLRVLGVEPTGIAMIARKNGIPTVNKFFSEEVARQIVAEQGKARVITAANVFAHVYDLTSMVRGIKALLAPNGVFVSESHYLADLIDDVQYDTIYHEHLRFYHLKPLLKLLSNFGFAAIDVEQIAPHGGSIRVFAVKDQTAKPSDRLMSLLRREEELGLNGPEAYERFRERVVQSKRKLLSLLLGIRAEGGRIVGIGAPARASMLVNYCRLDTDLVDYIVEPRGSLKVGLFMPGSHIPIVEESRMLEEQPSHALLLSWHIGKDLMAKLPTLGYRGKFIMPLPDPRVIG